MKNEAEAFSTRPRHKLQGQFQRRPFLVSRFINNVTSVGAEPCSARAMASPSRALLRDSASINGSGGSASSAHIVPTPGYFGNDLLVSYGTKAVNLEAKKTGNKTFAGASLSKDLSRDLESYAGAPGKGLLSLMADKITEQANELSNRQVDSTSSLDSSPVRQELDSQTTSFEDGCGMFKATPAKSWRSSLSRGSGPGKALEDKPHRPVDLKFTQLSCRKPGGYISRKARELKVESLPYGQRLECFQNDSYLLKDALGRVIEIKSQSGSTVSIRYDNDGRFHTFIRKDEKGRLHSLGELDTQGIIVRESSGKALLAGVSVSVDPKGCLSIHGSDGQFFSLDLFKGLHVERRYGTLGTAVGYRLTAVFASDGFRMMTRFDGDLNLMLRFYGRDGSVIQFESENELLQFAPSKVWPPGSKYVKPHWRGYYQAGTAWESVQEYIASYL